MTPDPRVPIGQDLRVEEKGAMDMEIHYCEGCGRILFQRDFFRGRARISHHRPLCQACDPMGSSASERAEPAGRRQRQKMALPPKNLP